MNYPIYLFSNLLKLFDFDFDSMPYDHQFDEAIERYKDFQNSRFDVATQSEYDCILEYLRHKYNAPLLINKK